MTHVWMVTIGLAGGLSLLFASGSLAGVGPDAQRNMNRDRVGQQKTVEPADAVLIHDDNVWTRYLISALRAPPWLDLGVEQRTRYEAMDHPFRLGEFGTDTQILQRSRLRVGLNPAGPFRLLTEFQDSRTQLDRPGDFVNNAVVDETDILQLFGSMTTQNLMGSGFRADLHLGRFTLDIGDRRLVGRNPSRNTTNTFEGVHWNLARQGSWRARAFLVRPVQRFPTALDRSSGHELFWGVFYETERIPWLRTDLYYFGLNDTSFSVTAQRQYSTFGIRIHKPPHEQEFDYEGETIWQIGRTGTKDHFAYFHHAELGYTFDMDWSPRVLIQFDYATGTSNPAGGHNGTFDSLFGIRRPEFAPSGIFGPFFRSNLVSPGWRFILKPIDAVQLTVKHRLWYLAEARDEWVGSGLQDPTGRSGNTLGQDIELRAQWHINDNLTVDAAYDHFFRGSYIADLSTIPGNPTAEDTDYCY